jgi:choline-sulfatase
MGKNRSLFMIVIIVFIFLNGCSQKEDIICEDCNIILIDIDSLRADHLGCYGYNKNTSPNIDKLAEESIVFDNFFIESPHTTLSKMSVFTSLYPYKHQVRPIIEDNYAKLDNGILTMPQILSQHEYTTVWVGPLGSMSLSFDLGFDRGFDYFIEGGFYGNYDWDKGIEWIKKNKDKKFFISLYSEITHDPYAPRKETLARFSNRTDFEIIDLVYILDKGREMIIDNPSIVFNETFIEENKHLFSNKTRLYASLDALCFNLSIQLHRCSDIYRNIFWDKFNPENSSDMELLYALYDTVIFEADQNVGYLMDTLIEENLLNNTIIVIYSDHGDEFWEHGGVHHGDHLYDEIIHVPFIIHIPGFESKRRVSLSQGVDILPTILDLIGYTYPKHIQGKSLLPLMLNKETKVRDHVFSETVFDVYSIRSKHWKYITDFKEIEELYDLNEDPDEKNNIINESENVKILLKDSLEQHLIS